MTLNPFKGRSDSAASLTPLSAYHRKLFVFLSVATFFEGYDFLALSQILPELSAEMGLSRAQAGLLVTVINIGTILAYLLVRKADYWGRKRLLTITIAGYTVFTFLTGFANNIVVFALLQLVARVFLIAEWAVSMVYAAEEFPADRRGMVIGVIQAFSSLGSIVCAGVVPFLVETAWGWRSVYFVGIVPLVLLAFARRGLRESGRFAQQREKQEPDDKRERVSFFRIWRTPYRKRMLQLGLIWAMTYLCTQNAVTFWKFFAVEERGLTNSQVGLSITIAAVASMPMIFYAGKLIDQIGRKWGAVIIFGLGMLGVWGCYGLHGRWALTFALVFGIFGASGVLPVLNAFNAELFPTKLRGDAFAWSNNLLGRVGYVLAPMLVGAAADYVGWGLAVQLTSIGLVVAVILILTLLPETKMRELEDTAAC